MIRTRSTPRNKPTDTVQTILWPPPPPEHHIKKEVAQSSGNFFCAGKQHRFQSTEVAKTTELPKMAERVGFEPTVPSRVRRFSRPLPSTTRPPLHILHTEYHYRGGPLSVSRGLYVTALLAGFKLFRSSPILPYRDATLPECGCCRLPADNVPTGRPPSGRSPDPTR